MKTLGIFTGGFKPFHVGHFAKVAMALCECDHVIISFGKGERKKGSDLFYSREMCESVYSIVSENLKQIFREKITTKISDISPVRDIFGIIAAKAFTPFEDDIGFDVDFIKSFDKIIVYGSEEDASKFTCHIGNEKEQKYFGNLIETSSLSFETDSDFSKSAESLRIFYIMQGVNFDDLLRYAKTRGSDVRKAVAEDDIEAFYDYMIPTLTNDQIDELYSILKEGV